jgi:hypothetical protein
VRIVRVRHVERRDHDQEDAMGLGSLLSGRRRRRTGVRGIAMSRWGGVGGIAASVLIPAAYRYLQRRRSAAKTMPGYASTPEYAAPMSR